LNLFSNEGEKNMALELIKRPKEEEEKVGVYICHCGGNISDHVDVQQLAETARHLPGVATAHTNMFMCSDAGQELIQEDIKKGLVNRIVVASCAPSLHETTFRGAIKRAGLNPYLYEQANIREQDSWVHHGQQATDKAKKLVAAAVAKAKKLEPLDPIRVEARNHTVVVGGGVAGLRAAIDLSRRGIEVVLVEKSPFLGGRAAGLETLVPTGEKAADLICRLAEEVLREKNITVYTCAEIIQADGYVGNFKLTLKRRRPEGEKAGLDPAFIDFRKMTAGEFIPFTGFYPRPVPEKAEEITLDTGALIMATGFKSYMPREGEYGFGQYPQVVTLPDLIRHMGQRTTSGDKLEWGGKRIKRVAMIHCVGSRQIPGIHEPGPEGFLNEYCSRTCCSATLQAASLIRESYPETRVLEYYRDIRTYGRGQEEYYERAAKNQVIFLRFEPEAPPVVEGSGGSGHPLKISVKDTLTFGEEIEAGVDLVVLSVAMEPNDITELVEMMKLPVGNDRFLLEVHPKLRPVEVSKTGILLAGTCQAPMDIGETLNAAQAASVKASSLLTKGFVELDPYVAQVDLTRCCGAGACIEACPTEGALQMVEMEIEGQKGRRAQVNPALCTGCGMCVAVCPAKAINVNGWKLDQYEAMVDAIAAA
jgi:heterodisulfide reductase subunit A2